MGVKMEEKIMKKISTFITALAVIAGLSSCTREMMETSFSKLTVTASIENTKVAYTEDATSLKAAWEVGDEVFGWWTNGEQSGVVTYEVESVGETAPLKIKSGTQPADGSDVYMVYAPALDASSISNNTIPVSFDSQKANIAEVNAKAYMSAQAKVVDSKLNFEFKQATAIIEISDVTLPGDPAKEFTLTVKGNNLCNSGAFELNSGVWGLAAEKKAESNISISKAESGKIFVAVPPTTVPTTFTFNFTRDGITYLANLKGEKLIEAGKCYTVSSLVFTEVPVQDDLGQIMLENGYNVNNYDRLDLTLYFDYFYNVTSNTHSTRTAGSGNVKNAFYCTDILSQADVPVGSIIIQKQGFKYRPESWVANIGTKQSARGTEIKAETAYTLTVVDAAYWNTKAYYAYNIAKSNGSAMANDTEKAAVRNSFAIFVPKTAPVTPDTSVQDEMMAAAGYMVDTYTKVVPPLSHYAFWYSSDSANWAKIHSGTSTGSVATNLIQFSSTSERIAKADLPVGSVVVLKEGYQCRPEAWTGDTKTTARPAPYTKPNVLDVTEDWWGAFNYRAFNLQLLNGTSVVNMSYAQHLECDNALALYVPKAGQNIELWKNDEAGSVHVGFGAGSVTEDFLSYADGLVSWTANETGAPRSATITVNGSSIKITQVDAKDFAGEYTFFSYTFKTDGLGNTVIVDNVNRKHETAVKFEAVNQPVELNGHIHNLNLVGLYLDAKVPASFEMTSDGPVIYTYLSKDFQTVSNSKKVAIIPELSKTAAWSKSSFAPVTFGVNDCNYAWVGWNVKDIASQNLLITMGTGAQRFVSQSNYFAGFSVVTEGYAADAYTTIYQLNYVNQWEYSSTGGAHFKKK